MTADQINLAGLIVAIFCGLLCVWQAFTVERVHWLWLLLTLAGLVGWAVTR